MSKKHIITKDIIAAFQQLKSLETEKPLLPRMIGLGNGSFIHVSDQIIGLISSFSREVMRENTLYKSTMSHKELNALISTAFAKAISSIDDDADIDMIAYDLSSEVEKTVQKQIKSISTNNNREYAFGCTLFNFENYTAFNIGPVRFEPRLLWLDRKSSDGCAAKITNKGKIKRFASNIADGPVSKTTKRRVIRIWNGERLKRRQSSHDRTVEENILRSIGDCPYVCSVKTPGAGNNISQEKALLSARLALTAISLMWVASSKAMDGLNLLFDTESRVKSYVYFTPDGLVFSNTMRSASLSAPFIDRKEFDAIFSDFSPTFSVVGEVIEWLLAPEINHSNPVFLNSIAQAMLWFHDGCRENSDLKAIVGFSACLEILSKGEGAKGIVTLISDIFEINEDTKFHRDGYNLKDTISQIYRDGRNRFVHGPYGIKQDPLLWGPKLGHDWSEIRKSSEYLARICLLQAIEKNPDDIPSDFPA